MALRWTFENKIRQQKRLWTSGQYTVNKNARTQQKDQTKSDNVMKQVIVYQSITAERSHELTKHIGLSDQYIDRNETYQTIQRSNSLS